MPCLFRRAALAALAVATLAVPAARAADDGAYREHDFDNVTRSTARHRIQLTDPEWHEAMRSAGAQSWLEAQGNQLADVENGRLHTGLGQILPGGSVGDPKSYNALPSRRIQFLTRTGAKLSGRIWGSEDAGRRPGIVITTGSIQATEHMYWWIAQAFARAGYVVMTYDVQGQGESEGFGHGPGDPMPTFDGFPSQQSANFVDGTVDALRFFLSTPGRPYRPVGWDGADVAAAESGRGPAEQIDWVNPGWAALDRTRLGIAGHSLGASAVSVVQQCSDLGSAWRTTPECHGQSFPIKAVLGWDSLSGDVVPVVPGMDQEGDGYFLNPTPSSSPPDPEEHLEAHRRWLEAGIDTYSFSVRGGTHLEWSEIPLLAMATAYGRDQVGYYSLAWFDRWVHPDARRRAAALRRLVEGPVAQKIEVEAPWRANYLSARYLSAFSLRDLGGRPVRVAGAIDGEVVDLRAYGGASAVGDWAGANADRQGRELP